MKKSSTIFLAISFFWWFPNINSQDTFSIVAVDAETGEVGSAGASCVDLDQAGYPTDDFLGELVPGVGAINTQAFYRETNQDNATERMQLGDTPDEIINWLIMNDEQNDPTRRQYGIAALINGLPQTAAYTGVSTNNYKGHITSSNYAIQGNILMGPAILDSMESRFLNEDGDLTCKLMAALQGANTVGADSRCTANGTSSLFAFVKVSQPSDEFGNPSFVASFRSNSNDGIEPIDVLQNIFGQMHSCSTTSILAAFKIDDLFVIYPNPAKEEVIILNKTGEVFNLRLIDQLGRLILQETLLESKNVNVSDLTPGTYYLKILNRQKSVMKQLVVH